MSDDRRSELERRAFPEPGDFETMEEFWDALEEAAFRNTGGALLGDPSPKERKRRRDLKRVRATDRMGGRQVGLRLPETDFARLMKISADHGVPPATMARMLVVRALRKRVPDAGESD